MRSLGKQPEWLPRALTVAASSAFFVFLGVTVRQWSRDTGEGGIVAKNFYVACKWGAITCTAVAGPVTGDIANTALQRTMGTIAGGIIGFLVRCIGDVLHTHFLALMYAATAAAIGGFGIWLGETVGGDDTGMWSTTAKLSVTTFLLVFADGKDPPGAFVLMMTRTTGIVMGLVATLALTILLLPESAHRQVDRNLSAALDELRTLHSLCWLPLVDTPVLRPPPERLTQAPPSGTGCVADETLAKGTRQDALQPAEAAETARLLVEGCEDRKGKIGTSAACLVKIYAALTAATGSLKAASHEVYVGGRCGMRFYIPRHFTWLCCLCGRRRFPRAATHRLCDAVRHVTRVQLSLNNLFEDGLNEFMVEVFAEHLPVALVPRLVKAISDVLMDCIDCFPHKTEIPRASWDAFETQVEALLAIRGQQRGRMEAQYTQFKRHAAEWRERVHDGSHALSDERERAESECEAASARASEAQSRRSGSVRGRRGSGVAEPLLQPDVPASEAALPDEQGGSGSLALQMHRKSSAGTQSRRQSSARTRSARASQDGKQESQYDAASSGNEAAAAAALTRTARGSGGDGSEHDARAPTRDEQSGHVDVDLDVVRGQPSAQKSVGGGSADAETEAHKPKLFSDTPEGQFAEVTYYTFQFHMRELLEAMRDMLDAQAALLVRMPSNASHMNT